MSSTTAPVAQRFAPHLRSLVASLLALSGAVALGVAEQSSPSAQLPWIGLVLAAVAIQLRALAAQLFARAAFWSNLGLGVVLSLLGGSRERPIGLWLAVGCGAALLVAGHRRLDEAAERSRYRPTAPRGGLMLLMVLTLADLQTFALFGAIEYEPGSLAGAWLLFVAAGLYGVCFVMLAQMRALGVVLTLATSLAILGVLSVDRLGLDRELREVTMVLAGVEVVAASLVLVSTKLPLPASLRGPVVARVATTLTVLSLVTLSVVGYAAGGPLR